jgi:ribonuclease P protein component
LTPPEAPDADAGNTPPAASLCLVRMRRRPDFLAAARARRYSTASLLLQARDRKDGDDAARVGFTCSKKLGNAVTRNRAKRRLRAVAAEVLPGKARPGWDYVLIGKPEATVSRPFAEIRQDLISALAKVHGA